MGVAAETPPTAAPSQSGPEKVQRWDVHEATLAASESYANPFQDVSLTATFTHVSSGERLTVDGFHDGGSEWRIRFMPTQIGTWRWTTRSNDRGLDGKTGSLECVASVKPYLRGLLKVQGRHFVHVDGTPRYLISTRLSCQFAPPSAWPPLIAFLKEGRINRVLFMMPGVDSKKDPVYTQRNLFAPGPDYTRYNVETFRAIDAFTNTLRQADILASPYFYYDPRREILWKMTPEQDRAYIRYGMARIGAFSNVMPVLGNEIELKTTNYKDKAFDLKSHAWANEMGAFLKSRAVFGQPVSVHNPCWHEFAVNPSFYTLLKDWPFAGWTDFMLKQTQLGSMGTASAISDSVPQPAKPTYNERAYARRNQVLIDLRRFGQPVIDEEPGYDMSGTRSSYNALTPETMRPTFWTAATAGAYTMWGSKSTYVTGDPLPQMKGSLTPQYMRVHHDVIVTLPYAEMEPQNECVTPANVNLDGEAWRTNYALAKPGEAYLVYSLGGGTGTVTLAPGRYSAVRVDPRDGTRTELGTMDGGIVGFSLPQGDWVLIYRRTAAVENRSAAARSAAPGTAWMTEGEYGLFLHYQYRVLLGTCIRTDPQFPDPEQMTARQWNQFVEGFDVNAFAAQMAEARVGWVIFCIDDHYFAWPCTPNKTFSKYTGYGPGEKCSRRDLIKDLAAALNAKGVKLICYYAGLNGYMKDRKAFEGLKDDGNEKTPPSPESRARRLEVLKEYCDHYGESIAGWWFDGIRLDSYGETPNDWTTIESIVRGPNPKAVIAFSYGPNQQARIRKGVDNFTSGDTWTRQDLTRLTPDLKPPQGGNLWHGKIYCGNVYHGLGDGNQFTDQELIAWIETCNRQGGVVTMD